MPDHPSLRLVDRRRSASVSFAPPDPVTLGPRGRTPTRAPIAVGPGRAVIAEPSRVRAEPGGGVTYPIQPGKIQAPALRDETLARVRLLDWLDVKIHSRVVFVIADAGYGKTTLLADFSRRTRLRTIWYRIDEEDRDWVGFLAHLVSAGREFDPEFAPRTAGILRSLEPGGPTREDAIETFLEELPAIAADGAALILDDFHLAEESPDIRLIAREIVARGPERLSVVFASRLVPSVPVAKLRSLGELAEIGIADLRFSDAEMEQLFRETYGRPLEPDVLSELARRTEGWAASLTLVQAALRERSPAETRSFVRGLSGARDELHDYLAEEVVGELPDAQQQFLMRTSILQRVTPELAQIATGLDAIEVQSMVGEAERLGMLGRRGKGRASEQRYHPLVREFLEDRLRREVGQPGVDELHLTVARWAEPTDWRTAAHHYAISGRWPDLQRVIEDHLQTIVASGAFAAAEDYVRMFPDPPRSAAIEVVLSRHASIEGDVELVGFHARRAVEMDPGNDVASANFMTSMFLAGQISPTMELAVDLANRAKDPLVRMIADATRRVIETSLDANLTEATRFLQALAETFHRDGLMHYEGVSWLNISHVSRFQGQFDTTLNSSSTAIDLLSTSSSGAELASARMVHASATALVGNVERARTLFREIGDGLRYTPRVEHLVEFADMEALVGDSMSARQLLDEAIDLGLGGMADTEPLIASILAIRDGSYAEARRLTSGLDVTDMSASPGYQLRRLSTRAMAQTLMKDPEAASAIQHAMSWAERQEAFLWREVLALLSAAGVGRLSAAVAAIGAPRLLAITLAAEVISSELSTLADSSLQVIEQQAQAFPARWRPVLRRVAAAPGAPGQLAAARLLDTVGDRSDIAFLRSVARRGRLAGMDRSLGRSLARRLAPRVFVADLDRVRIHVGESEVDSHGVRRKVLSLLCFLLSRARFSATREEVMEALWPEIDPAAAVNSLNQSVYFLRRIFEPEYSEETTAGYVRQDTDMLWLDPELVESQSRRVANLMLEYERGPTRDVALAISDAYQGRFALDFMYEDWSTDFREWLHVAYLRVIEGEVRGSLRNGSFDDGIKMARRALEVDPRHEEIELLLVRVLRASGYHSAAAEQYARYSAFLRRDLGIEPPSLESL